MRHNSCKIIKFCPGKYRPDLQKVFGSKTFCYTTWNLFLEFTLSIFPNFWSGHTLIFHIFLKLIMSSCLIEFISRGYTTLFRSYGPWKIVTQKCQKYDLFLRMPSTGRSFHILRVILIHFTAMGKWDMIPVKQVYFVQENIGQTYKKSNEINLTAIPHKASL